MNFDMIVFREFGKVHPGVSTVMQPYTSVEKPELRTENTADHSTLQKSVGRYVLFVRGMVGKKTPQREFYRRGGGKVETGRGMVIYQ